MRHVTRAVIEGHHALEFAQPGVVWIMCGVPERFFAIDVAESIIGALETLRDHRLKCTRGKSVDLCRPRPLLRHEEKQRGSHGADAPVNPGDE